jgi:exosortase family protein XrtG
MTLLALAAPTALWAAATVFFYRHRIWLAFYVTGSVGLALLLVWAGRSVLPLETWLKEAAAVCVHAVTTWFGIETKTFTNAPGTLLVLVIPQSQGWTLVDIGVECSGLLELAVLFGLTTFYPGWTLRQRTGWMLLGLVATFFGNLLRILFIVVTLHYLGKDTLYLSHTVIGRVLFFAIVVAIYWGIFTQPTLRQVRANLLARQSSG